MGRKKSGNSGKEKLTLIQKLEILKLYYIDEKQVKEIMQKYHTAERTIYDYLENSALLAKFIENLDPFVMKYLLKNSKFNPAYMKMLLENIMHKSSPIGKSIDGLAEAIAKTTGKDNA